VPANELAAEEAPADAMKWQVFTSAAGRFRVQMPGTPVLADAPAGPFGPPPGFPPGMMPPGMAAPGIGPPGPGFGPPITHRFELTLGDTVFSVHYQDLPEAALEQMPIDPGLDQVRQQVLSSNRGLLVSEERAEIRGQPGRYWVIEIPGKGYLLQKTYVVRLGSGHRLFALVLRGPKAQPSSQVSDKFFASFELTESPLAATAVAGRSGNPVAWPRGNRPDAQPSPAAPKPEKIPGTVIGPQLIIEDPILAANHIAFAPDGSGLAIAHDKAGYLKLYDAGSGKLKRSYQDAAGSMGVTQTVAFSGDGDLVACGCSNGKVVVWKTATGARRVLAPPHPPPEKQGRLRGEDNVVVAFGHEGALVASAGADLVVRLWDVSTGKPQAELKGHQNYIIALAFSPDDKMLATGSSDRTVRFWNIATNESEGVLQSPDMVSGLAFLPDGRTLVTGGSSGTLRLWDLNTKLLQTQMIPPRPHDIWRMTLSPDGKLVASGSSDGSIDVWDVNAHQIRMLQHAHPVQVVAVAFSPDGQFLAGASGRTVKVWSVAELQSQKPMATTTTMLVQPRRPAPLRQPR
jgi:WD40 repeat protein